MLKFQTEMHAATMILLLETYLYVITYMRPEGNLNTYRTGVSEHKNSSSLNTIILAVRMRLMCTYTGNTSCMIWVCTYKWLVPSSLE